MRARICGDICFDRNRVVLRNPEPCSCSWLWRPPRIACCPDHATFVMRPDDEGGGLLGIMCERCRGLLREPGEKDFRNMAQLHRVVMACGIVLIVYSLTSVVIRLWGKS